jgi:hypothetical protein
MLRTRQTNRVIWGAAIACAALSTNRASAQSVDNRAVARPTSCLDTVSILPSIPAIVYLRATTREPVDPGLGQMMDVFAQSVSLRMRGLLNPHGDTLPPGEPIITWRSIEDHIPLGVTVYRDAAPVFQLISPHTDSVAAAMLLDAVHKAVADGEGPFWPEGTPGDSLTFGLSFELTDPGKVQLSHSGRFATPVFSVLSPPEVPARAKLEGGASAPIYPLTERHAGITAVVIAEFHVDTTGHVSPGSIREVWPSTQKRPTGRLLAAYNDFLDSVMRWLPNAEFEPAHIGGCSVQRFVQQPFNFALTGRQ